MKGKKTNIYNYAKVQVQIWSTSTNSTIQSVFTLDKLGPRDSKHRPRDNSGLS